MSKVIVLCVCVCLLPLSFSSNVSKKDFYANQFFAHPKDLRPNTTITARIIEGWEVTPHSFPFLVAVFHYKYNIRNSCGGSLISSRWVLTAAHCLFQKPKYVIVVLGAHELKNIVGPAIALESSQYVFHDGWDFQTLENDVGLVRLPQKVKYNRFIQPAMLANGSSLYDGDTGTIVGWGAMQTRGGFTSLPRSVRSTILSNEDCRRVGSAYARVLQSTHLCAQSSVGAGSCSGDSGGPLFVDGIQVGIVSFGPKICETSVPSVFTRVSSYKDWITQHVDGTAGSKSVKLDTIVLATLCFVHLWQNRWSWVLTEFSGCKSR